MPRTYSTFRLGDTYNYVVAIDPRANRMARTKSRDVAKFEVFGQEMLEKIVKQSGNSGRVYLPPDWVGKRVKVIRVE